MKKLLLIFTLFTLFGGCAKSNTPAQANIAPATPADGLAGFSYRLFEANVQPGENTLISPISVALALSMAAEGAANETLAEFERLLGHGAGDYYAHMASALQSNDNATVTTFNSIYVNSAVSPKTSYLKRLANAYNAQVYTAPFTNSSIVRRINSDVAHTTNNLITEIIDSLSEYDRAVLLNTLYFKADWRAPFEANGTHPGDFFTISGTVQTKFMTNIQSARYAENSGWQAVSLPYRNERYAMLLLMPAKGKDIKSALPTMLDIPAFLATLQTQQRLRISMPKFTAEHSYTLGGQLARMGLPSAFDPGRADFSGILDDERLHISQVIHKTKLIADEKGTEAAAATAITIRTTSIPLVDKAIRFDRPFIYILWDDEQKVPLFMGVFEKPEE